MAQKVAVTDYTFPDLQIEKGILEPLGCEILAEQCKTPEQLKELVRDVDHVITQFAPVNADVISAMTKARVIVRYGIGYDNVDTDAARERGIPVCNIPDFCTDEVADHTLALILDATRQIARHDRRLSQGEWALVVPTDAVLTLAELTVGVVGFGRIGREVIRRLIPFKCEILVADPVVPDADIEEMACVPTTLEDMVGRVDVITLHCPSTSQTRGLLNRDTLARLKPGAIVVNPGRGDLIDTAALIDALEKGQVSAASLDVTDPEPAPADSPLRTMEQVTLTPHIASVSGNAMRMLRESAANTVASVVRGEAPPNVVNGV